MEKIKTVEQYLKILEDNLEIYALKSVPSFIRLQIFYRGLNNVDYELLSPIGRHWNELLSIYKKFNIPVDKLQDNFFQYEESLLEDFIYLSKPQLIELGVDFDNMWEILALSRHHGLRTRVMDWTTNPLVALYFAASEENGKDGIVYFTDKGANYYYSSEVKEMYPFEKFGDDEKVEDGVFFKPSQISDRVRNQSAVLFVQTDPRIPYKNEQLGKIIINSDFKTQIIYQLDSFGINAKTLFSGMDGIAKYLNKRMFGEQEKMIVKGKSVKGNTLNK